MDMFLKKCSAAPDACASNAKRQKSAKASAMTKKKKTTTAKKSGKIAGKTLEQHRRTMGDGLKSNIHVEKWYIEAHTHCTLKDVEPEVFRQLVVANASSVLLGGRHAE